MIGVGDARVHLVSDGRFAMDGGAMFGIVPKPLWSRHVSADDRNRIPMSLHCPVIEDGQSAVLVDAGLGDRLSAKEREIYRVERDGGLDARLHAAGIDPEEVGAVVLTHLHFDHVGGVVRERNGRWVPAFPRARHFIQRAEWETALAPGNERLEAAYAHASQCLEPLREAGLVELLDGDTALTPHLEVRVTGGHTPAHQCPVYRSGDAAFVHLGDLAPTRAHLRPAWNQGFDLDPLETLAAKKHLLSEAREGGWWVSFDHDHEVACARLGEHWERGSVVDAVVHSGG